MQRVWKWELYTYFGLSWAQIEEAQVNWNTYYNDNLETVLNTIPSEAPYNSATGVAYWQWADSFMTRKRQLPPQPSVINATNTVTGYVEYYYWLNFYCSPVDGNGAISEHNWQYFNDTVTFVNDASDPTANMEYLWNLFDPVTGADPAEDSLFNLTTLKALVSAGNATPNIIRNPEIKYG